MKKTKQKSKGKRASFFLGLPFTLLVVVLGLNLVVSGIDSLTYSSINTHDEAIAMIVGGACVVVLGVLHFRSGVFMPICGAVSSIGMVAALVVFLSDYIPNGKFIADGKPNGEAIAILGLLTACLIIGILELIGGIIAIRNVKRMKKVSPWIRKHKKPVDFLKNGLTTSETIIERDYSTAFYDKGNLNVFKVVFPDATVLYRQQAVLRIANRLFVAGNDLSGNADGELTFFF